ncbi:hypothetical protein ACFL1H_05510, partial [Nanoarchaeota archaeon]
SVMGNINEVYFSNTDFNIGICLSYINKMVTHNYNNSNSGSYLQVRKIIKDHEAKIEYQNFINQHNITDLLDYFNQMQGEHYSKEDIYKVKQMVEELEV